MIKTAFVFIAVSLTGYTSCTIQEDTKPDEVREILMIGTFHFANPGLDVAKTKSFDILKEESQQELEEIAEAIKQFSPSKIFVEWPYQRQIELDSLYELYIGGNYFDHPNLQDHRRKSETAQLAFRAANKLNLSRVYAIDYRDSEFPYDSMMAVINRYQQSELQKEIDNTIAGYSADFDAKVDSGSSLKDILFYLNTDSARDEDIRFYTELATQAGSKDDFTGPYLTSEWYRRNIYMWSLIQKTITEDDKRIMILSGASHVAILAQLLSSSLHWKTVELRDIMNASTQ